MSDRPEGKYRTPGGGRMQIHLSELDVFYLTYDEPQREATLQAIRERLPKVINIHGVKGFDAAHKTAAEMARSDRFIVIDGDNSVRDWGVFRETLIVGEAFRDCVLSFKARNAVNGLEYGNGGLKVWPKPVALAMRTHEAAERPEARLDFCWDLDYYCIDRVATDVHVNGSPEQAYRAGFREGIKTCMDRGRPLAIADIPKHHRDRLLVWCNVGRDAEHGVWAILGARSGVWAMHTGEIDPTIINDYDRFAEHWAERAGCDPEADARDRGEALRGLGLEVADLDAGASAFFKTVFRNPERSGPMFPERFTGGFL